MGKVVKQLWLMVCVKRVILLIVLQIILKTFINPILCYVMKNRKQFFK